MLRRGKRLKNNSKNVGSIGLDSRSLCATGRIWILIGRLFCAIALLPSVLAMAEQPKAGRGFSYHHDEISAVPWSIHVIKVDRSAQDLEFHTTLAKGTILGLSTLTEQLKSLPADLGRPIAGINGDYYRTERNGYEGDPKGLQILNGEMVSGPCDWSCVWFDAAGNPHLTTVIPQFKVIWPNGDETPFGLNEERGRDVAVLYTPILGPSTRTTGGRELILERESSGQWLPLRASQMYTARVRQVRETGDTPLARDVMILSLAPQLMSRVPKVKPGDTVKISTSTLPDLTGVKTAIGGGPALVRNGKLAEWHSAESRQPRSAIGWNKTHIFLVEVDGRQRNLSVGMTWGELADYMIKLGCEEAMNLDGGGSATLWFFGQVVNSPSQGDERAMANALFLIQKDKSQK